MAASEGASVLVDTNVVIDVLERDITWYDWSVAQLRAQAKARRLLIAPVIYAELAFVFQSIETLDDTVTTFGLTLVEPTRSALFLAAKAFGEYRRRSGPKSQVLPDFFIGAQAAVLGCPILTRDTRRYSSYFPSVLLIAPSAS